MKSFKKSVFLFAILLQTFSAAAGASPTDDLKAYIQSPEHIKKANSMNDLAQGFYRDLSQEEYVELFNATVSTCQAQVDGHDIIFSQTTLGNRFWGPISVRRRFEGAWMENKTLGDSKQKDDRIYLKQLRSVIQVNLTGESPVNYEMNFGRSLRGDFFIDTFVIEGTLVSNLFKGQQRQTLLECEPSGQLAL